MKQATKALLQKLGIHKKGLLEVLRLPLQSSTIFLSGSVVEGYGSSESDLDVYIPYAQDTLLAGTCFNFETIVFSSEHRTERRLDIESWSTKDLLAVADLINRCSLHNIEECLSLQPYLIVLAHNILTGIPLQDEERFQHIQQAFDEKQLSQILLQRFLAAYKSIAEDIAGAMSARHYGITLLLSRLVVQLAIDALLASHGETNSKEKWHFHKLEKFGDTELLQCYWTLETPRIEQPEDILQHAKACLLFAREIIETVQKADVQLLYTTFGR